MYYVVVVYVSEALLMSEVSIGSDVASGFYPINQHGVACRIAFPSTTLLAPSGLERRSSGACRSFYNKTCFITIFHSKYEIFVYFDIKTTFWYYRYVSG